MERPLITLTTDFGLADPSVGILKGVILSIAPDAEIVDISHGVARHSVLEGASLLAAALPYFPIGVHVAVVDPGVGTDRRPIALRTGRGDLLVGPDNGLLMPAADALGGALACHELANPAYRLATVSRTFHGRDIFSPAAAHFVAGIALELMGPPIDVDALVRIDIPAPRALPGALEATVVSIDSFGSAQLLAGPAELESALGVLEYGTVLSIADAGAPEGVDPIRATRQQTYGDAPEGALIVIVDSYGNLAVAVNQGNAAERYGFEVGVRLTVRRG